MQDSDEDELEGNIRDNPNDKICMNIIERIKLIFDILRKNNERSVNNLAVYIDNFFHKRKIDIRANIKVLKENIKENEEINIQRNKEIKETLEDLKYKIKGYSAKKERILNNELEKIEGKKLIFDEEVNKEEEKENMIIENEDNLKVNNEPEENKKDEQKKAEEIIEEKNEEKKVVEIKEEIKDDKKEEKII